MVLPMEIGGLFLLPSNFINYKGPWEDIFKMKILLFDGVKFENNNEIVLGERLSSVLWEHIVFFVVFVYEWNNR